MGLETIHQFRQAAFHSRGTCYFQCEYLWGGGPYLWYDAHTYVGAVQKARTFTKYQAMMNYALTRQSQHILQPVYAAVPGALVNSSLYSCSFFVATIAAVPVLIAPNHEILLVTNGNGTEVCFYDPNFGFFTADATGVPALAGANNRQILECYIDALYANLPNPATIHNYQYFQRRAL